MVQEIFCVMTFIAADRSDKNTEHRLRILVADDDDLNRRMMRLLLVRDGHDVQVVANGMEALEAVKEQHFDVVFMDLQMPIMDGLEASRQIRAWENGNLHTYIVALTASYLPEEGHLLYDAGIDNYISKPFEVEHIRKLLQVIARSDSSMLVAGPVQARKSTPDTILDVEKGIQRVGGDPTVYRELLADFIQGLSPRISILEKLVKENNAAELARAIHNLKGVSSNLGAFELCECASKLDQQSNAGYTDQNQTLLLDLRNAEIHLQKIAADFLSNKEGIGVSA